jgi:hypothetical protein
VRCVACRKSKPDHAIDCQKAVPQALPPEAP